MTDVKEEFEHIYAIAPQRIIALNNAIMALAKTTKVISIRSSLGTELTVELNGNEKWTNLNGIVLDNPTPSEVATGSETVNGRLVFTGSMLSTIPFAIKHGLIKAPIEFTIKNSRITAFNTANKDLKSDLDQFFSAHPEHNHIDEVGIGTNEAIRLVGSNCFYEEVHAGLHLGLAGKAPGSHHLDLITNESIIHFDDKLIFDGRFHL